MSHLLKIDTSLRHDGSRSRQLTAHFAQQWSAAHPGGIVTTRDLALDPVPQLDETAYTALFVGADERTPAQQSAWDLGDAYVAEVLAADTVVVGLPMYNFGPPTAFLAWMDRIVTPDRTMGKLGDKKFVFAMASGGGYGAGTPREGWDHREGWLRHSMAALGVTDPAFVSVELTMARESPAMIGLDLGGVADQSLADGLRAVGELAA
jgi:FMN-dependent NADH-azoreductase